MPYITREDGVHFVIPSYRDVLSAKQKSQLKKDILLLSQSYGEYITLQKKSATQYEVAFSPDTGYLLGESIWHQFKRPMDMIYCEAIPNTTEAILVIVKSGSVYLDGRFPLESIPEELIIFLTQQNNFEVYIYGDVPISELPEEGKFNFEASSIKSFNTLSEPVFPTLPLLKIYQLQLVEQVLRDQGIGVMPTRQLLILTTIIFLGLAGWWYWSHLEVKPVIILQAPENPLQGYMDALNAPEPDVQVYALAEFLKELETMPGWTLDQLTYDANTFEASVQSKGGTVVALNEWCLENNMTLKVKQDGFYISTNSTLPNRAAPTKIYPLKDVIGIFVDRLDDVYPGNQLKLDTINQHDNYSDTVITITLTSVSPSLLKMIGNQMKGLPIVLQGSTLSIENDSTVGSITLLALGT